MKHNSYRSSQQNLSNYQQTPPLTSIYTQEEHDHGCADHIFQQILHYICVFISNFHKQSAPHPTRVCFTELVFGKRMRNMKPDDCQRQFLGYKSTK